MYTKIKNDPYIIDIYSKISAYEDGNRAYAHHNLEHVTNVAEMVGTILTSLDFEPGLIEEAKVAALLHDLGCIEGKKDHPSRSYQMAKEYLNKNNFNLKNEELVLEAIKHHSDGFETDNIITRVLMICDKLDIKKNRVAHEGYQIPGMKEMQYINDIEISIKDKLLTINFLVDGAVDRKALENYYFIPKVFKSIESFAKKTNLKHLVLFNNKKWVLKTA